MAEQGAFFVPDDVASYIGCTFRTRDGSSYTIKPDRSLGTVYGNGCKLDHRYRDIIASSTVEMLASVPLGDIGHLRNVGSMGLPDALREYGRRPEKDHPLVLLLLHGEQLYRFKTSSLQDIRMPPAKPGPPVAAGPPKKAP